MLEGLVAEMATGEGKTLTASLTAAVWGWHGKPVHIITVNDYLVARDAEEMGPIYQHAGPRTSGTSSTKRPAGSASIITAETSFMSPARNSSPISSAIRSPWAACAPATQTVVGMLMSGSQKSPLLVPGLWQVHRRRGRQPADRRGRHPADYFQRPRGRGERLALPAPPTRWPPQLEADRDFTIDWTLRQVDLTQRGEERLDAHLRARRRILERQTPPRGTCRPGASPPATASPAANIISSTPTRRCRSSTNSPAA